MLKNKSISCKRCVSSKKINGIWRCTDLSINKNHVFDIITGERIYRTCEDARKDEKELFGTIYCGQRAELWYDKYNNLKNFYKNILKILKYLIIVILFLVFGWSVYLLSMKFHSDIDEGKEYDYKFPRWSSERKKVKNTEVIYIDLYYKRKIK